MQNNPNQNIHTDYVAFDVFKPMAANQLAKSIHYDFVITQDMIDNYVAHLSASDFSIDVGGVIASNPDGTSGPWETPVVIPYGKPINIFIAGKVPDGYYLNFHTRLIGIGTPVGNILDCTAYSVDGNWDRTLTHDMVNVFSAYPYAVSVLVAGFNFWSTPETPVTINSPHPNNYNNPPQIHYVIFCSDYHPERYNMFLLHRHFRTGCSRCIGNVYCR